MTNSQGADVAPPVVRVALGWRAREVEHRSTARVAFPDDDRSAEIFEDTPVALAYAEPAHAIVLPPGRFLRVNQAAGRVYDAKSTPHLEALAVQTAVALADSVARLLEGAGWQRVPGAGVGTAAVHEAARFATSGNGGFGVTHVGTWRVPRPHAAWAALPPGAPQRPGVWDGVEALVTVRPVRAAPSVADARLILQVDLSDQLLGGELNEMVAARRRRYGGEMRTLGDWDAQPDEQRAASP